MHFALKQEEIIKPYRIGPVLSWWSSVLRLDVLNQLAACSPSLLGRKKKISPGVPKLG